MLLVVRRKSIQCDIARTMMNLKHWFKLFYLPRPKVNGNLLYRFLKPEKLGPYVP